MINQNVAGVFNAPSLQNNRQAERIQSNPIQRIGYDKYRQKVGSVQTHTVYVLQEAPRTYIRSQRGDKTVQAYRAELNAGDSREAADQAHIQRMSSLMNELRQSDNEEGGFIQKHFTRLMEEREKYMESDEYQNLPSVYDYDPAEKPVVSDNETAESGLTNVAAEEGVGESGGGTERAQPAPEQTVPTPEVNTASGPDPSVAAFVSANIAR